ERGRRSGTENVACIFGFGKACEFAKDEISDQQKSLFCIREYLFEKLSKIKGVYLNGHPDKRVSNTLNIGFEDIEGESLVMNLDLEGIAVSTGSACSEGNVDPSHVLLAMGLGKKEAISSLRISFGKFTEQNEIEKIIEVLPKIVERIRGFKEF
ncbi:MAG: cysteine desulfurase family protein, partial [Thermodesulfobacteriota bacterium]